MEKLHALVFSIIPNAIGKTAFAKKQAQNARVLFRINPFSTHHLLHFNFTWHFKQSQFIGMKNTILVSLKIACK
jgi:hypothetical protein